MEPIDFNQYRIGVPILDYQHQKLFDLINGLAKDPQNSSMPAIQELMDYAHHHFRVEEELMAAYKYPKTKEHMLGHDAFRIRAESMDTPADAEEASRLSQTLVVWLRNWLVEHIDHVDRQLALHVKKSDQNQLA